MMKRFLKNLSDSWLVYLLVLMNLFHAIQTSEYDWLLWLSVGLTALSIVLNLISAIKGDDHDA